MKSNLLNVYNILEFPRLIYTHFYTSTHLYLFAQCEINVYLFSFSFICFSSFLNNESFKL